MDQRTEIKADFDHSMVTMNAVLRELRQYAFAHGCCQPLHSFAVAIEPIMAAVDKPMPNYARAMRRYAKLITAVADTVDDCQQGHPSHPCVAGGLMLQQMVVPVLLSISCVAAGFELKRGKDMKLEGPHA